MRPTSLLAVAPVLLGVLLGGCTDDALPGTQRTLVIGVGEGEPGFSDIGEQPRLVGFDVDVARYVAQELGWSEQQVELRPIPRGARARALAGGEVDLVVSTFRMSAGAERLVDFAGPYLVGRQDLLVRADEAAITGPHSLDGRVVCAVAGSPDGPLLQQERFSPGVRLRPARALSDCVDDLVAGTVDAVTADDVALAGYVRERPSLVRTVDAPFAEHYYGIGLPEGSPDTEAVAEVLARLIGSGVWRESYLRFLQLPGRTVPDPPVPGSR